MVKKYLVMKMVEGIDAVAGMIALPGLYTLDAAQNFVAEAVTADPEGNYLIQEVGAA